MSLEEYLSLEYTCEEDLCAMVRQEGIENIRFSFFIHRSNQAVCKFVSKVNDHSYNPFSEDSLALENQSLDKRKTYGGHVSWSCLYKAEVCLENDESVSRVTYCSDIASIIGKNVWRKSEKPV